MREFDAEQVRQLVAGPKFVDEPTERVCPACGKQAVRTYIYRHVGPYRTVRMTYSWCASCRRFKGWTGPDMGPDFDDPLLDLSDTARNDLLDDLASLFAHLDTLWETGRLPQTFRH